jgi:hypothetical protein
MIHLGKLGVGTAPSAKKKNSAAGAQSAPGRTDDDRLCGKGYKHLQPDVTAMSERLCHKRLLVTRIFVFGKKFFQVPERFG